VDARKRVPAVLEAVTLDRHREHGCQKLRNLLSARFQT
jgi:hypothetical protein